MWIKKSSDANKDIKLLQNVNDILLSLSNEISELIETKEGSDSIKKNDFKSINEKLTEAKAIIDRNFPYAE